MAIRIRVYPGGTAGSAGYGGAYGVGGVSASQYYSQQLANERQTSDMKLSYEKQLYQQKLKAVELEAALKYGANTNYGYGGMPFGLGGLGGLGALGSLGAMSGMLGAGMMGGYPSQASYPQMAMPGLGMSTLPMSGQVNINNQTALGAANQTASNSNVKTVHRTPTSPYGMPFGSPYGSPYGAYGAQYGSPYAAYGSPYGSPYGGNTGGSWLSRLLGGI